jgi:molybdopterin-synthase adenylyltransferase
MTQQLVTIVGVGALGSHAALLLRNVDATLKIIDDDRVEARNLASQFHAKPNVGQLKVESVKRAMQYLYGRQVVTVPHRLTADNAEAVLGGSTLVIDALDNFASRQIVSSVVRTKGIPCLHGALAADGAFGRVCWEEAFVADREDAVGAPTCENGDHLAFIALVSAYLAHAAKHYLTTGKKIGHSVSPAGAVCI